MLMWWLLLVLACRQEAARGAGGDSEVVASACTDADVDGWCVEEGDCDDANISLNPGHQNS